MSKSEFWYCNKCEEEVLAENVTYQENHDRCGNRVEWFEVEIEENEKQEE